jgi:hypothetical protein
MALLVTNCPRCGTKNITFDLLKSVLLGVDREGFRSFEAFSVCRHCQKSTVFLIKHSNKSVLQQRQVLASDDSIRNWSTSLDGIFDITGHIAIKNFFQISPPDSLPLPIKAAFEEGAACLSIQCHNASATMFRLCVDLATRPLLPDPQDNSRSQPNSKQRRDLGLRIPWLFSNNLIPADLSSLAHAIKEDGNDGAHQGNVGKEECDDILDFTRLLLERLYTEPEKIKAAQQRREVRRQTSEPT